MSEEKQPTPEMAGEEVTPSRAQEAASIRGWWDIRGKIRDMPLDYIEPPTDLPGVTKE
jgi:hypothetical protein